MGNLRREEWVHFWVRKDDNIAEYGESPSAEMPDQAVKEPVEQAQAMAAEDKAPEQTSLGTPPGSPVIPWGAEQGGTDGTAVPIPPAAQKSKTACHKALRELDTRMMKQKYLTVAEFMGLLGSSYRECKSDNQNIYCFKCTVIGQKTDSIEAIEIDGSISDYHYGGCGCPE